MKHIKKYLKIAILTILVMVAMVIISSINTKIIAASDPSSSHGFADFDDKTAGEQANKELNEQETEEEENKNKSSNNYLSSIEVEGFKLTPEFDKQTINYTLQDTKSSEIEISAVAEDTKANVSGTGKISLNYGENDIKIDVTAESGMVRTYHIKVNNINENTQNKVENNEEATYAKNSEQQNVQVINVNNLDNKTIYVIIIIVVVIVLFTALINRKKNKTRRH